MKTDTDERTQGFDRATTTQPNNFKFFRKASGDRYKATKDYVLSNLLIVLLLYLTKAVSSTNVLSECIVPNTLILKHIQTRVKIKL